MRRCDVCQVRVGPCVDENGVALEQYHVARVRTDAAVRVDYGAEAVRLRQAAKAGGPC